MRVEIYKAIELCRNKQIIGAALETAVNYLPEDKGVEDSLLDGNKKIVSQTNIINSQKEEFISGFLSPFYVLMIFLILSIYFSFRQVKYGVKYFLFDISHLLISGIIGCVLVYLWFFTDHLSSYNFNIIWAMPFNIIIAVVLLKNKKVNFVKWYFFFYGILLSALLILWKWIPQNLSEVLILFILGIITRLFVNYMSISKLRS